MEQIAVGRSHSKMVSSSKNGNSYLWRLFPNSKECFNIENRIHSSIAPDKIIISRSSPVLAINAAQVAKFSVHQFMPHCEHPCEDNHRNRISDIDTCEELRLVFKPFSISDGSPLKKPDIKTPLVVSFLLGVIIHFSPLAAF